MRLPQRRVTRQQHAQTLSVSAPVSGWNARDSLADMKPTDAVILDNMFCTPYDVVLRKGYSTWATGITGTVNTIFNYSPTSGAERMFAAAGANIYETTTSGAVGAPVVTGLLSDKWQYTNFANSGGNFLLAVNGQDAPRAFNGTSWGGAGVTGPTVPSQLVTVTGFKARLWFIEQGTMKVWYLPVNTVSGAATAFDMSSIFPRGGYLMQMGDWSLDAGYGMDDYAVFITSEGQVAVYKGTDPASAATWALIGVYDIGEPVGRRCMYKYGGDLLIVTRDGLVPLSKALMSSRVNTSETLTDKIQHVVSDYISQYGQNFGWKVECLAVENMLLLNVPASGGSFQLVMNTISGAWSRFLGWNTNVIELYNNDLYFGVAGGICKAWNTNADNGTNINFEALQSFNYFGRRSQLKKVEMLRPIIMTDGWPAILLGVNVDFDRSAPTGSPTFSAGSSMPAVWDTSLWDGISPWGGELSTKRDWQTAFGLGYCIAAHMKGASRNYELHWISTDYVLSGGGVI